MSKQKAAVPVAPRNLASLQVATKLLEVICLTPVKARNIAGAVREVERQYAEAGKELPVSSRTLRFYAEKGVVIAGHPELAQPFLEVAKLYDGGRNILVELGHGDAAGLMLTGKTLDKAVGLMGEILESDEGKESLKGSPKVLNEMVSRLTAAYQVRQKGTGGDVWGG